MKSLDRLEVEDYEEMWVDVFSFESEDVFLPDHLGSSVKHSQWSLLTDLEIPNRIKFIFQEFWGNFIF